MICGAILVYFFDLDKPVTENAGAKMIHRNGGDILAVAA